MRTSCRVCAGLATDRRGIQPKELSVDCSACTVLRRGITCVLGERFFEIISRIEIQETTGEGQAGPLRVDVFHMGRFPKVSLQFYHNEGQETPWPSIGLGHDVGSSGASSIALRQIQRWLQACLDGEGQHRICTPYREDTAFLPARVLDVGEVFSKSSIKLHIPRPGDTGRYVALSHCWGGKISTVMTEHNLQEFTESIPLPLPQTFQDAVWLTRALGIRYLWVDSFCIMQDSLEDWHAQAPQMAGVYGNAYATLSADAASDSTEGFLDGQRRSLNTPQIVELNFLGLKGQVRVRERCSRAENTPVHDWTRVTSDSRLPVIARSDFQTYSKTTHTLDAQVRSPLSKRAWVFQERVLSPRTLHFGHAETGWECHSLASCECSSLDSIDITTDRPTLKDASSRTPWMQVVQLYSYLSLSRPEDRLVALSGLAERRQKTSHDRYLAGLWMSSIRDDLLWSTVPKWQPRRGLKTSDAKRHRLNMAPTWSWASTSGPIQLLVSNADNNDMISTAWKIKSVTGPNARENPFAATIRASLRIEGFLVEVHIEKTLTKPPWVSNVHAWCELCSKNTHCPDMPYSVRWDNDDDPCSDRYSLFLTSEIGIHSMTGLVLQEENDLLQFRRVGFLMTDTNSNHSRDYWIGRFVRKTFTIS